MPQRRKLAATLFADVPGYSLPMHAHERATVETRTAYRKQFRDRVRANRGRVVVAQPGATHPHPVPNAKHTARLTACPGSIACPARVVYGDAVILRRAQRGPVAACLVFLLLFAQFATAAYACPQRETAVSPAVHMEGCEEVGDRSMMDMQNARLCLADCEQDAQASQTNASVDIPAPILLYIALAFLPSGSIDTPGLSVPTDPAPRGQPPPGWPPLYLFNRILRN